MNVPNKTKGFTIIEVVLVLAIAGLIFLVVFLALPALQRGQRDTQRKTDLGKFMSQVTSFQSNNQGALPADATAWGNFLTSYLRVGGTPFADPSSGGDYSVTVATSATAPAPSSVSATGINVYRGMSCGAGALSGTFDGASRKFAAVIYQEQGGFYCQNN
jgi:prepilin-type N-terminal cleavage/methylation domain-containing protein